jgi:hypothetical protein
LGAGFVCAAKLLLARTSTKATRIVALNIDLVDVMYYLFVNYRRKIVNPILTNCYPNVTELLPSGLRMVKNILTH